MNNETTIRDERSLGWADKPHRELMSLSGPIVVSMLSYGLMSVVDTLFVGQLGPAALAGVSLANTLYFTTISFSFGVTRGAKVVVAQAVGGGEKDPRHLLGASLAIAAFLCVVSAVVGFAIIELMPLISASQEAARLGGAYLSCRLWSLPCMMVYASMREYRYALGDTRTPMVATLCCNVLNIVLDYVFVMELQWGVEGAAIATVMARWVELSVLLVLLRKAILPRLPKMRDVMRVLRMGLPTGLQYVLEVGAFATLAMLLAAYSELDMAAHQVALQVLHFVFLPVAAVADAVSVLAGQAVGANRDSLVPRVMKTGLFISLVYSLACIGVLVLGSSPIAFAFTDDPELAGKAQTLLMISCAFLLFDAVYMCTRAALRGAGDVKWAAFWGVVLGWALTPPLTYGLGYLLDLGSVGGWIGLTAEIFVGAAMFWRRVARGDWKVHAERSRQEMVEQNEADKAADSEVLAPADVSDLDTEERVSRPSLIPA